MFDKANRRGGPGGRGDAHAHHPGFGHDGPRHGWGEGAFGGGPFGHGGPRGGFGGRGGGGFGGGWFGEGRGGGGGRARRGEARYVVLDVLRDGPKHGYEIIKVLEERSGGRYAPSPGAIYPVLQYLEELGFVLRDQDGERRVYRLTESGEAEWRAHADEIAAFWERFAEPKVSDAARSEIGFLFDEFRALGKTAWTSAESAGDDAARLRAIREALERCKNEIRSLAAGGTGETPVEEV